MRLYLEKIIKLELLAAVLVIALFFLFDFFPKVKRIGELKKELGSVKNKPKSLLQEGLDKKRLEEEKLRALQQVVLASKNKITRGEDIPFITNEMMNVAALSNIELASIKSLNSQKKGKYASLPIELRFQSTYAQLAAFLSNLKTSSVLWSASDAVINRDETNYPRLDVNLTILAVSTSE